MRKEAGDGKRAFKTIAITYYKTMKKTIITALLSMAGVAMAAGGTANLGNDITGTWTEYNMQDSITTGTDSITLPSSWGGPTAWITLASAISLTQDQKLTFSYTYSSTTGNGIYGISFQGEGGASAFMIGNTDYGNRDLAAATTTLGTTGFYGGKAQNIRFNAGNSTDRIQAVTGGVNLGTVSPGLVEVSIAFDSTAAAFIMTLECGEQSETLNLGSTVAFDTISFSGDANATQSFSGLSMNITTVPTHAIPEPATTTLSLLALAGLAMRRRRL